MPYGTRGQSAPVENHCWLEVWPTNSITSLSDEAFSLAVQDRLGAILPFDYVCPLSAVNMQTLSVSDRTDHVHTCESCSAAGHWLRHELVVKCIKNTCARHGLVCESNPPDLPRPGNARGGPDFVIWHAGNGFCGDVVVTKNNLETAYKHKDSLYESFAEATSLVPFPFAMNTSGKIHRRSLEQMRSIGGSEFCRQLEVNAQFAVIKGIALGLRRLKLRKILKSLDVEALEDR